MRKLKELVTTTTFIISLFFFQFKLTILFIELEIKDTKLVIKNLEKELAQEEEIRRNKAEYDQLAAVINQQKTRKESSRWAGKQY
jgi:hypothetical protein